MRILGIALCTAALALGTGGVSLRPAAAQDGQNQSLLQEYSSAPAPEALNSCQLKKREPPVLTMSLGTWKPKAGDAAAFQAVNSRGYNYPAADDPPERPVPAIRVAPGAPSEQGQPRQAQVPPGR